MSKKTALISGDRIGRLVCGIRGHKVMLDADLATLYGVPTHRLNEAVKRNRERFPEDFMFRLTWEELEKLEGLISQFAISNGINDKYHKFNGRGGRRKLPYAFTEQGVAMLSSVLKSKRAVQVNIAIMRAFVSLRGMMRSQENIKYELAALKRQSKDHDDKIKTIFLLIDEIMAPPPLPKKRKIGFL